MVSAFVYILEFGYRIRQKKSITGFKSLTFLQGFLMKTNKMHGDYGEF